jgi:hypothetical protein
MLKWGRERERALEWKESTGMGEVSECTRMGEERESSRMGKRERALEWWKTECNRMEEKR